MGRIAGSVLCGLFCVAAATSQTPAAEENELDEVLVQSQRLYELRAAIVETEDRFYALYNELNKDEDFDIHCEMRAPTGTVIKERSCEPVLVLKAQEAQARSILEAMQNGGATRGVPMEQMIGARASEYRKNLLHLINSHPELRELVKEQEVAQKRYERARRERMQGRVILFE